jgi:hypothetical protein
MSYCHYEPGTKLSAVGPEMNNSIPVYGDLSKGRWKKVQGMRVVHRYGSKFLNSWKCGRLGFKLPSNKGPG